ncbi:MAG: hypothetical protein ACE5KZ_15130 [Candidatus Scalinduaceae bacterium]
MDWGTHVVLAAKLLESCELDKGAAIYSVIPVIDKEPPHFHRVYAHILENQPDFLEVALEVFNGNGLSSKNFAALHKKKEEKINQFNQELKSLSPDDYKGRAKLEKKIYAHKRIVEEVPGFLSHAEDAVSIVGDEKVKNISQDKLSAAVSLLSHTYFDVWNNPVQVFLPNCSNCSAHWDFWNNVDYMKFRGDFYKPENIIPFRKEIANSNVWKTKLKPEAMIKAMIIRLGELGQPVIPYEIIDMGVRDFMRYLDINDYQKADKELEFCHMLESEIHEIIYKNYRRIERSN